MSTPPGSPLRTYHVNPPQVVRRKRNNMNVNSIINKLKNNNNLSPLLNQFKTKLQNGLITEIGNRNSASDYNKIYISTEANNGVKKVYKVGLKKPLTNEFLCYSLLKKNIQMMLIFIIQRCMVVKIF